MNFNNLKLLANENVNRPIIEYLNSMGVETKTTFELGLNGKSEFYRYYLFEAGSYWG